MIVKCKKCNRTFRYVRKKNITQLLEGEYDFSALPALRDRVDRQAVGRAFASIGKEPMPQFNCGFLIFKNGLHHKIKELWLEQINTLSDPELGTREQWALSLALASTRTKIRNMTFQENARAWAGKIHSDAYVLHGREPPMKMRLRCWLGRERRRIQRKVRL